MKLLTYLKNCIGICILILCCICASGCSTESVSEPDNRVAAETSGKQLSLSSAEDSTIEQTKPDIAAKQTTTAGNSGTSTQQTVSQTASETPTEAITETNPVIEPTAPQTQESSKPGTIEQTTKITRRTSPAITTSPTSTSSKTGNPSQIPTTTRQPVTASTSKPTTAATESAPATPAYVVCTLEITTHILTDNPDFSGQAPANGIILKKTEVTVPNGSSVYDVLSAACSSRQIKLHVTGSAKYSTIYVVGIAGIKEKQCGNLSGWKYDVNSVTANMGCSSYTVSNGDHINWYYVTSPGQSLKDVTP